MKTFNGLPLYVVAPVTEDDGVIRVSLVEDPAVESNFEVFRNQSAKAPAMYAVQSEERRLVRGVVLRADYPIFRRDAEGDPGYYVTFPKAAIRQLAEKYLAEDRANNVDTDHDGVEVDGVRMVQMFIKDAAAGVDPEGFTDIEDGSLFAEYHVTNDEVWDEIKDGTWRGFSVEVFYRLVPAQEFRRADPEDDAGQVSDLLRRIISKMQHMSKMEKLKARLAKILAEFGSVTTDKGVIHWDGDEDLKAGDRVEVEDNDGNREAAADGDYTTGDGKVIVVVDGAVSEIRDPEAEVASEGDGGDDRAEAFRRTAEKFAESYDEKQRRIFDAIKAARGGDNDEEYCYLVSAGDSFGVICAWGEDYVSHYYRYAISWDGDEATASDPVEVREAYVPLDFDDNAPFRGAASEEETPSEEDFERAVRTAETYRAENELLRRRVAALEKEPAGKPAPRAYRSDAAVISTGDKGLDRLARRFGK